MSQREQLSLPELSTLSLKQRLRILGELATQFENPEFSQQATEQHRTAFAEAFIAVQRGIVEDSSSGKLTDNLRQVSEMLIFKTVDQLAQNNIRIPIPESIQIISSGIPLEQVNALEKAKETVDQATKHSRQLTELEQESVVGIILSFQHFLCKAYKVKDRLSTNDWDMIQKGMTVFKQFIPELIKAGIQIPLSVSEEKQPQAQPASTPAIKESARSETKAEPQPSAANQIIELATEIGTQAKQFVENGIKNWQQKQRNKIKAKQEAARKQQEAQQQQQLETEARQLFIESLKTWFPSIQCTIQQEIKTDAIHLLPGDVIQVKDNMNQGIFGYVLRGSSRSNLMRFPYNFLAMHRTKIGNLERGSITNHPEIIGRDYSIGLTESIRTYTSEMGLSVAAAADRGVNYGNNNQDRVVVKPDEGLFVVIDGIGGGSKGDLAADILAEKFMTDSDPAKAAYQAHLGMEQLYRQGEITDTSGAGFVSAKIRRKEQGIDLEYSYSGDCSLIVLHADGRISVGEADSYVDNQMVAKGILSPDEALYNPHRNIVEKSITPERSSVQTKTIAVEKGDRVIMASDGIGDNLTPEEIRELIQGLRPEEAIAKLDEITSQRMQNYKNNSVDFDRRPEQSKQALAHRKKHGVFADGYRSGAKPDNRSVIVFDIY